MGINDTVTLVDKNEIRPRLIKNEIKNTVKKMKNTSKVISTLLLQSGEYSFCRDTCSWKGQLKSVKL